MKKTLLSFEIDINRMPLGKKLQFKNLNSPDFFFPGKLAKSQINKGFKVLKEVEEILSQPATPKTQMQLKELTNRFYTQIPHSFGHSLPPLLNNKKALQEKIEMLESLTDMEIASKIITKDENLTVNPVDDQYSSLNCGLQALDHEDHDFKMIVDYVKLTHAPTHNSYSLEVLEVFKVRRFRIFGNLFFFSILFIITLKNWRRRTICSFQRFPQQTITLAWISFKQLGWHFKYRFTVKFTRFFLVGSNIVLKVLHLLKLL